MNAEEMIELALTKADGAEDGRLEQALLVTPSTRRDSSDSSKQSNSFSTTDLGSSILPDWRAHRRICRQESAASDDSARPGRD